MISKIGFTISSNQNIIMELKYFGWVPVNLHIVKGIQIYCIHNYKCSVK